MMWIILIFNSGNFIFITYQILAGILLWIDKHKNNEHIMCIMYMQIFGWNVSACVNLVPGDNYSIYSELEN